MSRMENDEAHAFQNSLLDRVNHLLRHLFVPKVPPPDQNICICQSLLGKPVLRLV